MISPLGKLYLMEFFGCEPQKLNDVQFLRETLIHAAKMANATVVTDVFHPFNPYGISGVVVIAESHLAIHTWPEHQCASIDLFSCSDQIQTDLIEQILTEAFQPHEKRIEVLQRGVRSRGSGSGNQSAG